MNKGKILLYLKNHKAFAAEILYGICMKIFLRHRGTIITYFLKLQTKSICMCLKNPMHNILER